MKYRTKTKIVEAIQFTQEMYDGAKQDLPDALNVDNLDSRRYLDYYPPGCFFIRQDDEELSTGRIGDYILIPSYKIIKKADFERDYELIDNKDFEEKDGMIFILRAGNYKIDGGSIKRVYDE